MRMLRLRQGDGAISAVGEQYNTATLRQAWKLAPNRDDIVVALIPEPRNRYDSNAVRMDIVIDAKAYKAGYIASEEAGRYQPLLNRLWAEGIIGYGHGKIRESYDGYQVYVRLETDPLRLLPPKVQDPHGVFVDGYYPMAVVGEEQYQAALQPYALQVDYLFALHPTTVAKGKYAGQMTYAVYLDGQLVGQITRGQAEKHFERIDAIFRANQRPYLLGRIESDHRGLQVVLEAPRRARRETH